MFLDLKTRISLEFVIRIQHLRCLRKADTRDKLIRVVICHGKNKRMPQSHFLCKNSGGVMFLGPKNWNISGIYYHRSTYGVSGESWHSGEQKRLMV